MSAAERTIYIVEKHLAVADSMRALLESAGLCVEVYDSGAEFADAFDSRRSSCLVLDIDPSSASAFEILDDLSARGFKLPVILITWSNDAITRNRAKRAEVVAFLEKPISDALLLDAIECAFSQN